jgi:DNA adenine methylase
LADEIIALFPQTYARYFEPFLGGGAVFFRLHPSQAILADSNRELINAYITVQTQVDRLMTALKGLSISSELFYMLRAAQPSDSFERAVRFMYLNRTAFNGMYRVSQEGKFNVPFGCKPKTVLCQADILLAASLALGNARLLQADFEEVMEQAGRDDLVYADPPYTTKHDNNGFRRYNESIFSWADQERLAEAAMRALARGATVVVSNAHHEELRQLYQDFQCHVLTRTSCISGKSQSRGQVSEYLFVGKPIMRSSNLLPR